MTASNPVLEAIASRRSVRQFTGEPVAPALIEEILRAGIWAPSGLNNQPWRFAVLTDRQLLDRLADLTHYHHIVRAAPVCIAVFLHRPDMYHEQKDHQAAGACLQNMLLAAHSLGLGAVWLGQILANAGQVNQLLGLDDDYELQAVVALGHPAHRDQRSERQPLDHFLLTTPAG